MDRRRRTARRSLLSEIDELETLISNRDKTRARDDDGDVRAEIEELEGRLSQDEDIFVDDEPLPEEEPALMDEVVDDLDAQDELEDEMAQIKELEGCLMTSSEEKKDVEDDITQDSLTEVEDEAGSKVDTEPDTKSVVSFESRIDEATKRLDRVATYLEKQGRKDLALKIDKLSDALDAQREN